MTAFKKALGITFGAALLLSSTACNTNFNQGNAGANQDSKVAEINKSLEGNLYVEAAAESGKGSNKCEAVKPADQKLNLAFSIEGLSHPFLAAQVKAAQEAAKEVNANMTIVSGDDNV